MTAGIFSVRQDTLKMIIKNTSLLSESDVEMINTDCPACKEPLTELYKQIENEEGAKVFTYTSIKLCGNPSCGLKIDLEWIKTNSHWKTRNSDYVYEPVDKAKINKNNILKTMEKLNEELGIEISRRDNNEFLRKW